MKNETCNDPLLTYFSRTSWTNYDAVRAFVTETWKGQLIPVGASFILPDIDQEYVVAGVTFRTVGKRKKPLLSLEAKCAVEGCDERFTTNQMVSHLRKPSGLVRTCEAHRGHGWRTPCDMPWIDGEQRDRLLEMKRDAKVARDQAKPAHVVKPKIVAPPKTGKVEALVLRVREETSLVGLDDEALVRVVAARLPRSGLRDQRVVVARRAMNSLYRRGRI